MNSKLFPTGSGLENTVHILLYSLTHHTTAAWKPSRSLLALLLRVIHVPGTYLDSSYATQNQLIISPCLGNFSLSTLSPDLVYCTRDSGIPSFAVSLWRALLRDRALPRVHFVPRGWCPLARLIICQLSQWWKYGILCRGIMPQFNMPVPLTIIDAHTIEFTSLHPSACN